MLLTPHVSEKSYKLANDKVYVFDVPLIANKAAVVTAVTEQYPDVTVRDVRLMITKGKPKRVNRGKRSRPTVTSRKDVKKAYVTLSSGQIEIATFSEIEDEIAANGPAQAQAETSQNVSNESKKAGLLARRRTGSRGDR